MFDTKLANSIQQEYRRAAADYRLSQLAGNRSHRPFIATSATTLIVAAPIFILLAFIQ